VNPDGAQPLEFVYGEYGLEAVHYTFEEYMGMPGCEVTQTIAYRDGAVAVVDHDSGCSWWPDMHAEFERPTEGRLEMRMERSGRVVEGRYTLANGGATYVEEDVDGEPLTTAWYDRDGDGRVTHLVYWGHQYVDPRE